MSITKIQILKRRQLFVPNPILLGEGNGNPLQYSCLEIPMDGGAWKAAVHGVTTSWTRLGDFTFTFNPVYATSTYYCNYLI